MIETMIMPLIFEDFRWFSSLLPLANAIEIELNRVKLSYLATLQRWKTEISAVWKSFTSPTKGVCLVAEKTLRIGKSL